eukprot:TRINITY_DN11842_c0_g2_i1.p1 TRINITY_DN11842_c0_g2~~TRINITY_DN11842_c0_g2_i1.p1  ORF type:complete len:526 (+),score=125.85 TRINITY_DN11842_c0_g2_i1:60-1580(+)
MAITRRRLKKCLVEEDDEEEEEELEKISTPIENKTPGRRKRTLLKVEEEECGESIGRLIEETSPLATEPQAKRTKLEEIRASRRHIGNGNIIIPQEMIKRENTVKRFAALEAMVKGRKAQPPTEPEQASVVRHKELTRRENTAKTFAELEQKIKESKTATTPSTTETSQAFADLEQRVQCTRTPHTPQTPRPPQFDDQPCITPLNPLYTPNASTRESRAEPDEEELEVMKQFESESMDMDASLPSDLLDNTCVNNDTEVVTEAVTPLNLGLDEQEVVCTTPLNPPDAPNAREVPDEEELEVMKQFESESMEVDTKPATPQEVVCTTPLNPPDAPNAREVPDEEELEVMKQFESESMEVDTKPATPQEVVCTTPLNPPDAREEQDNEKEEHNTPLIASEPCELQTRIDNLIQNPVPLGDLKAAVIKLNEEDARLDRHVQAIAARRVTIARTRSRLVEAISARSLPLPLPPATPNTAVPHPHTVDCPSPNGSIFSWITGWFSPRRAST